MPYKDYKEGAISLLSKTFKKNANENKTNNSEIKH